MPDPCSELKIDDVIRSISRRIELKPRFSTGQCCPLFGLQWLDSYRMSRNELQIVNVKFVVTYPIRQTVQATSVRVSSCVCTIPGGPAFAAVVARD